VETGATEAGCPACGVIAEARGRRSRRLHDIPAFGAPVELSSYFNVNIAALAQKLDEWATMPHEVLDQHKARAIELSRQFDPEVLRPQYEAVFSS
jgi:hypothetical protein